MLQSTGGIAIAGFTTVGMVGVIAASHIIRALKLNQLGTVLNADFPAVALIQDEIPKPFEIREHLDSYVIGQEKAKKYLSKKI